MWCIRSLPVANTRYVMSAWPKQWILQLPKTTDRGVDTACSINCHCLCLWSKSVAFIHSRFVMIAQATGLGMRVAKMSRPLRSVGVQAMPDAGLTTMGCIESVCEHPLGAGVLLLLVSGLAVGEYIIHRCVADRVQVPHRVISATREVFSKGEGVEFWPWVLEVTELPPWEESLLPASMETSHLAGGRWYVPKCLHVCCLW